MTFPAVIRRNGRSHAAHPLHHDYHRHDMQPFYEYLANLGNIIGGERAFISGSNRGATFATARARPRSFHPPTRELLASPHATHLAPSRVFISASRSSNRGILIAAQTSLPEPRAARLTALVSTLHTPPMANERTPLLGGNPLPFLNSDFIGNGSSHKRDIHQEFCLLVGVPPSNGAKNAPHPAGFKRTLYGRAIHKRNTQNATYLFTAALSNTLLLTQVVLGAALTALGASESSHILITVFGALNTVIAGLVAYLKSRGQPMRARMFRDDLDRVVDEMENSEVMWLGIQQGMHGYDEVAIDDSVSVRSEVARLTRLLDKAVRSNTMNDRKSLSVLSCLALDSRYPRLKQSKATGSMQADMSQRTCT